MSNPTELEQPDPQCRLILNALPDHLAILDSEGVIRWTNLAWDRFCDENGGLRERTGIGASYLEACRKAQATCPEARLLLRKLQVALHHPESEFVLEYPCHSPVEKRWFDVRIRSIRIRDARVVVVLHRNVTTRAELKEELHLEKDRVGALLRRAALAEWDDVLSHEVKGPLSVILTQSQLMRRILLQGKGELEFLIQACDRIISTGKKAAEVFNSLSWAPRRIMSEPFEKVSVIEVVLDAVSLVKESIPSMPIDLRVEGFTGSPVIECRRIHLIQILFHLLANASDSISGKAEGWIRVEVKDLGAKVRVSVVDNGSRLPIPGISGNDEGSARGLGMKISRTLAEAQQGRLFWDEKSKLTRFVLEVPKHQEISRAA